MKRLEHIALVIRDVLVRLPGETVWPGTSSSCKTLGSLIVPATWSTFERGYACRADLRPETVWRNVASHFDPWTGRAVFKSELAEIAFDSFEELVLRLQLAGSETPVFEIPKKLCRALEKKGNAAGRFVIPFRDLREKCKRITC